MPFGLLAAALLRHLLLATDILFARLLLRPHSLLVGMLLRHLLLAADILFARLLLRLHPLLVGMLARFVRARIGSMRRNPGRIAAWRRFGGLRRLRFGLAVAVLRVFALLLRGFAGGGLSADAECEARTDDAGEDVLAQGIHVVPSGSRPRPSTAVGVKGA
jgi:anti-sigma factor RsiW